MPCDRTLFNVYRCGGLITEILDGSVVYIVKERNVILKSNFYLLCNRCLITAHFCKHRLLTPLLKPRKRERAREVQIGCIRFIGH